jgi:hypothetical protein
VIDFAYTREFTKTNRMNYVIQTVCPQNLFHRAKAVVSELHAGLSANGAAVGGFLMY